MHRKHLTRLGLGFLFLAAPLAAQTAPVGRTAYNSVYLELGGNALVYSVNYERMMPTGTAFRAGLSYMSVSATSGTAAANANVVGIPLTFSYLGRGTGSVKLELGAGATFEKFSGSSSVGFGSDIKAGAFVPLATFIAGLRIAPPKGGFNFKLAFTPFYHPDIGFFPWGGMSFGMSF